MRIRRTADVYAVYCTKLLPLIVVGIALFGSSIKAFAQTYDPKNFGINESAFKNAKTQLQMNEAMREEFDRATQVMDSMLHRIEVKYAFSPDFVKLMQQEQDTWLQYVQEHVATIFPSPQQGGPLNKWGSSDEYYRLRVRTEMVWSRVRLLYKWLDNRDDYGMYGMTSSSYRILQMGSAPAGSD